MTHSRSPQAARDAEPLNRDEALQLNRQERGRALYDGEIDWYLADCQTSLRHGTADLGTEIAEQLRDRLRAALAAATPEPPAGPSLGVADTACTRCGCPWPGETHDE